jgi:hypothetical protein
METTLKKTGNFFHPFIEFLLATSTPFLAICFIQAIIQGKERSRSPCLFFMDRLFGLNKNRQQRPNLWFGA